MKEKFGESGRWKNAKIGYGNSFGCSINSRSLLPQKSDGAWFHSQVEGDSCPLVSGTLKAEVIEDPWPITGG